jgi:hypothetical protein
MVRDRRLHCVVFLAPAAQWVQTSSSIKHHEPMTLTQLFGNAGLMLSVWVLEVYVMTLGWW